MNSRRGKESRERDGGGLRFFFISFVREGGGRVLLKMAVLGGGQR